MVEGLILEPETYLPAAQPSDSGFLVFGFAPNSPPGRLGDQHCMAQAANLTTLTS